VAEWAVRCGLIADLLSWLRSHSGNCIRAVNIRDASARAIKFNHLKTNSRKSTNYAWLQNRTNNRRARRKEAQPKDPLSRSARNQRAIRQLGYPFRRHRSIDIHAIDFRQERYSALLLECSSLGTNEQSSREPRKPRKPRQTDR